MLKTLKLRLNQRAAWLGYLFAKRKEKIASVIAYRLPRRIVYWCAIRLMVEATTGEYSSQIVPDLTAMDALKRWECGQ
jgi:hypothetical protein